MEKTPQDVDKPLPQRIYRILRKSHPFHRHRWIKEIYRWRWKDSKERRGLLNNLLEEDEISKDEFNNYFGIPTELIGIV